ncbi:MAG TPA: class I poly(R)-hydroxyalkanoic acid synthase [Glaciecola sp.]|nr:class I poly(R)-hydroxyalkanoic acid synthase [Glaciecola sp.]
MGQNEQEEILQSINKYSQVFNAMVQDILAKQASGDEGLASSNSVFSPNKLISLMSDKVEIDSAKLLQSQFTFMEKQSALWQQASMAMMGEASQNIIDEQHSDRRFSHDEWQANPVYSYVKQAYLLNSQMLENIVDAMDFKDSKTAEQIKFYTRQYINSVSPTNYVLTNPEVCEDILKSKGESILKGMQNFMEDFEKSPIEAFKITQTDHDAFTVGENLAMTPGEVVFKNELIELIHYNPTVAKTNELPLLFVPPFINKFYVLDLDERKSAIKALLDAGNDLFVISWINPEADLAANDFTDYMKKGPIAALDAVCEITKAKQVNLTGFCVGGTLSSVTTAYLRAQGDTRIASLTLLTTLLDFSEPGEIANYLSEEMLPVIENNADMKGIFDGRILALSFSLLRENSLFWSFFIKNYLQGKDPAPFDILYWNSDSTNIPAACFKDYLRNTYWDNKLKDPNAWVIDGVGIDLANIDVPVYVLATMADHIVLWQSAYSGLQYISGEKRFVLAGSGHLAGVINPIKGGKYPHWLNDNLPNDAEEWFSGATEHPGSWWTDWHSWLNQKSSKRTKALVPGAHKNFPVLYPAPGEYVLKRL